MAARRGGGQQKLRSELLPRGKNERRRVEFLGVAAIALFLLVIVGGFFAAGLQKFALRSPNIAAVVSALLVELANGDRVVNGLDSLTSNPTLVAVAQAKANDMAAKEYFAHVSPEGIDPWHWFEEAGYTYQYAGENLAVDFSDFADVERAWMGSPTHRDNILNGRYTEIGIASAEGTYQGRSTTFVVQVFGTPASPPSNVPFVAGTDTKSTVAEASPATSPSDVQVLGSAASEVSDNVRVEPAVAAALSEEVKNIPAWGYAIGFPRDTLRYAYYCVGLLILLALAIDTGLEIKWHHRKKALHAGMLLVVMCMLFVVADYVFFVEPVVALTEVS